MLAQTRCPLTLLISRFQFIFFFPLLRPSPSGLLLLWGSGEDLQLVKLMPVTQGLSPDKLHPESMPPSRGCYILLNRTKRAPAYLKRQFRSRGDVSAEDPSSFSILLCLVLVFLFHGCVWLYVCLHVRGYHTCAQCECVWCVCVRVHVETQR